MIVSVEDGLSSALDEVSEAAEPSRQFLRRAWFQAAVDAYACGLPRTLVGRRADGRPVIAVPLVSMRRGLPMLRTVPGCYWPFRSFPIAEDLSVDEMAAFLSESSIRRALGVAWRVGPMNADDPVLNLLVRAAEHGGWGTVLRRVATSYVLDFNKARTEGPWPRGTTLRKNRFHEKHLASHGALEWRFVTGQDWSACVFDDLAAIEMKSWVGRNTDRRNAKFIPGGNRTFWEAAARDPDLAARMWAAVLYVGGDPVAFSFDLDCPPVKYAIANSYDEALAKHSPGKVLYYRNLVASMDRGVRRVDWGAGDSGYKTTIGAEPGPEILDLLLVRGRRFGSLATRVVGRWWSRSV